MILLNRTLSKLEISFITVYINHLLNSIRDEKTLERELIPLEKIDDSYPKYILTLDDVPEANHKGIKIVNALDWLLGKV